MSGNIEYRHDRAAGILRVKGTGLWTVAQVDAHFAEMTTIVRALRAEGRAVHVLVDITEGAVQSAEVAERIRTNTQDTYRAGDRIAMLVGSAIVKMQTRRIVDTSLMELFLSAKAAEMWLKAYDKESHAA